MKTPIRDFVVSYAQRDVSRLHMPGHKGRSFIGAEKYDITEIDGADVLSSASGIIAQSEKNASELFCSYRSFYSTEGSSLCIRAMLAMISTLRKNKSEGPLILAARNAHKAFIYASALCDARIIWLNTHREHICVCDISQAQLRNTLRELTELPDAVYVTSPDYLGNMLDIKGLSAVCDEFGVPLLVDNAHGAYLAFLEESLHPINNGAYMCCDSAHKTLPVLTAGAYLHLSEKAKALESIAKSSMALMGSTSPSYLVLQSLDMCNAYLENGYRERLSEKIEQADRFRAALKAMGYSLFGSEPLKVSVDCRSSGLDSESAVKSLREKGIEVELHDKDCIVMMISCENTSLELEKVLEVFSQLRAHTVCSDGERALQISLCPVKMTVREAIFSPSAEIPVGTAEGRICAEPGVSCPPAVPIVVSGEEITQQAIELMTGYGIESIRVVV